MRVISNLGDRQTRERSTRARARLEGHSTRGKSWFVCTPRFARVFRPLPYLSPKLETIRRLRWVSASCITLVTRLLYNHQESHGLVCYQGEASLATIQIFCGFRQGLSSYDQQLQDIQSGANRFLVWMNPPCVINDHQGIIWIFSLCAVSLNENEESIALFWNPAPSHQTLETDGDMKTSPRDIKISLNSFSPGPVQSTRNPITYCSHLDFSKGSQLLRQIAIKIFQCT